MLTAQFIDGRTRLVGLLGWPVAHSLSPAIHNHAFRSLKLPFVYVPLGVPPEKLAGAVAALRTLGFAGANVTIPHKQAAAALCDELSATARLTGSVNTLCFDNGRLTGTTTDPDGFLRALAWMRHEPRGGRIVVLGNGGVARAIGFALAQERIPASLVFIGRDRQRVSRLAEEITGATGYAAGWAVCDTSDAKRALDDCTLLVNCTSVGMHPHTGRSPVPAGVLRAGMTVFDTIYNPACTTLLSDARAAGCIIQNGLRMLLYQALASFKLWTGVDAPENLFDLGELQALVEA